VDWDKDDTWDLILKSMIGPRFNIFENNHNNKYIFIFQIQYLIIKSIYFES